MKFKLVEENTRISRKKKLPTFSHADLLTVEEAEKVPQKLRKHTRWWWLKTDSGSLRAPSVFDAGDICRNGDFIENGAAVRPALRITGIGDYRVGSLFKFGGKWFQIVDDDIAFCLSNIGIERYDINSSNYEKSEIKRFVDNWFNENNKG